MMFVVDLLTRLAWHAVCLVLHFSVMQGLRDLQGLTRYITQTGQTRFKATTK